jgi:hypothetical protein
MITILVAKDKILVTIDTCDYKPCNSFEQVAKKTILQKKLHMYSHINSWISHAIIGTFHPLINYRPMQLHI